MLISQVQFTYLMGFLRRRFREICTVRNSFRVGKCRGEVPLMPFPQRNPHKSPLLNRLSCLLASSLPSIVHFPDRVISRFPSALHTLPKMSTLANKTVFLPT